MEKKVTFSAKMENLDDILSFIKLSSEQCGIEKNYVNKIVLASEEAIVNVIKYAYPESDGDISIRCSCAEDPAGIIIEISDSGISFDPLDRKEPDINKPVEEREVGGLGIFMIKKIMDKVNYRRENGRNILILQKNVN